MIDETGLKIETVFRLGAGSNMMMRCLQLGAGSNMMMRCLQLGAG